MRARRAARGHWPTASLLLAGACAAWSVARLARFAVHGGEDIPTLDDWLVTALVGRILGGAYNWRHYLSDSFFDYHSLALPTLIYLVSAKLAQFSVRSWIGLAVGFTLLRAALYASCFGQGMSRDKRGLIFAVLLVLMFAPAQLPSFEQGNIAVQLSLHQLGLALALVAASRHTKPRRNGALMLFGGVIASYSWGAVIPVWIACLAALALANALNRTTLCHWLVGTLVGLWPQWPRLAAVAAAQGRSGLPLQPDPQVLAGALGAPLSGVIDLGVAARWGQMGLWAALLVAVGALVVHRRLAGVDPPSRSTSERMLDTRLTGQSGNTGPRRARHGRLGDLDRGRAVALALVVYALAAGLIIAVIRTDVAPWYAAPFSTLWIGLVGASLWLLVRAGSAANGRSIPRPFAARASIAPQLSAGPTVVWLLAPVVLCAALNWRSLDRYSAFMRLRSPAGVSCLRSYAMAPTYCERTVFGAFYSPGDYDRFVELARTLDRHHLSVFGSNESWWMQGDYVLGVVSATNAYGASPLDWEADVDYPADDGPVDVMGYPRLNLRVQPGEVIRWSTEVPAGSEVASLTLGVRSGGDAADLRGSARPRLRAVVAVSPDPAMASQAAPEQVVSTWADPTRWQDVVLPLESHSGNHVTVELSVAAGDGTTSNSSVLIRRPRMAARRLAAHEPAGQADPNETNVSLDGALPDVRPANVDVAPGVTASGFAPGVGTSSTAPGVAAATRQEVIVPTANLDDLWWSEDIQPVRATVDAAHGVGTWRVVGPSPAIDLQNTPAVCLGDYRWLEVQLAVPPALRPRSAQVFLQLGAKHSYSEDRSVQIPLLGDGALHTYRYDLWLLPSYGRRMLTRLRLDPLDHVDDGLPTSGASAGPAIRVGDVRLVGANDAPPGACR